MKKQQQGMYTVHAPPKAASPSLSPPLTTASPPLRSTIWIDHSALALQAYKTKSSPPPEDESKQTPQLSLEPTLKKEETPEKSCTEEVSLLPF